MQLNDEIYRRGKDDNAARIFALLPDKLMELDNNIECPVIMNFSTGKERNAFVAVKGKKKEKGLSFNLCPFCGRDIMNAKGLLNTDTIPYHDGKTESN